MSCPTFICNFFVVWSAPCVGLQEWEWTPLLSLRGAHPASPCHAVLLILLPFFCTFLFCISSGFNNNHICPVFLLPFCKELFGTFFWKTPPKKQQLGGMHKELFAFRRTFSPLQSTNPSVGHGDIQAVISTYSLGGVPSFFPPVIIHHIQVLPLPS